MLTDTERAVLGDRSVPEVRALFSTYTEDRLGSPISEVRFRAGRIDVVWGVQLTDGRAVVIKAYRQPVDRVAITAATRAQSVLGEAGFPCPAPLSGPDDVDGHVLRAETMITDGTVPQGRDRTNRRLLAAGLAEHIEVLRDHPDLLDRAGAGPAWCRHQAGPWPVPHDPIVDFTVTPDGYGWLDDYARRAADQIETGSVGTAVVVGHADWYAGNTIVADGALVGTFDWELVVDTEAAIAGFSAAAYGSSSSAGGGLSDPDEVTAFLRDYEVARRAPFTPDEQATAAAAAAWIVAFNARWELGMGGDGHDETSALGLVRRRGREYLTLTW